MIILKNKIGKRENLDTFGPAILAGRGLGIKMFLKKMSMHLDESSEMKPILTLQEPAG